MRKLIKVLADNRIIILSALGASLYLTISVYKISLWYVLLAGVVSGIIFGKVFCRWVCPIGLMMEFLTKMMGGDKVRQMYQYHKLGCPIAWISGFLNKYSLFRIKLNESTCRSCGICDKKCYIVAMEPSRYSLYKPVKMKPGDSYTCSKCLECVASCPNGSLQYKVR